MVIFVYVEDVDRTVERAVAGGATWGLAVLAFSAVIREGLETSIFLAAGGLRRAATTIRACCVC